ncbi:MAG: hypothetical protein GC191_10260 [Azospirillum sp.]|nr:hypothetical protein [Azospirillum sp.]
MTLRPAITIGLFLTLASAAIPAQAQTRAQLSGPWPAAAYRPEPILVAAPGDAGAAGAASTDGFVSIDTVIIGCTAGAAAGALAVTLPALTVAATGVGAATTASALAATAGIGCIVGVVSGLAAIGTALGLHWVNTVHLDLTDLPKLPPLPDLPKLTP